MGQVSDSEFECRGCRRVVPLEQHKQSRFCPNCGTLLRLRRQPKQWLFQFNPALYRWFDRIKESKETEQWLVSQYAKEIHNGDKVAVWASGENAGVYAVGEIITEPRKRLLAAEQEKYWVNQEDLLKFEEKYSVTLKYTRVIIDRPLLEDACNKDPILSGMGSSKAISRCQFSAHEGAVEQNLGAD